MNAIGENLNTEQRKAVELTEGPMLIIAGAGTGKTKVLSSRILHLLLDKKVPANQILALTFTEKATEEMVERVDKGMPLSYEEVAIKTFHGFCDHLLRESGLEIGLDPGFKLLNQTEQWLFLKKNLFSFELNYYRPLGNPSKFLFLLLKHFSRLKDEDISPEAYVAYANNLMSSMKEEAEKEDAEKTLEIAHAYQAYQKLMQEQNSMDFGDLTFYSLRLLEKRPSVLQMYQDRYRYILVDEYQDTNFSQNKLVMMLASRYKNFTVVGDDDQSIYKWRGASLSNILNFEKHFPDCQKVVLTENYRSTQNVLDVSYNVIQNNNPFRLEARENISKKLRSQKGEGEPVEVWHFSSYLAEAVAIAKKIKQLKDEQGYLFKDFAILVRTNENTKPYIEAFKDAEIPFTVRDTHGLLRFEEVKDLVALLRFLVKPYDDVAFFRLLCLPIFALSMGQILELARKARLADYEAIFFHIRRLLEKDQTEIPGFNEANDNLEKLYQLFDSLLDFTRDHSVSRTLGEFLDKSGYYNALTKDFYSEEKASPGYGGTQTSASAGEKIQHISQFLELTRGFESETGQGSVRDFLEYLQLLEEAQGVVSPLPSIDEDAVSLLTVHSAKGLEFDYVFMPSLVAHRFPAVNRRDPLSIPSELIAEELPEGNVHVQEERRLFYVGCTRAKEQLFLSYSDYYEGPKKWKISPFIVEALSSGKAREINFVSKESEEKNSDHVRQHAGILKKENADKSTLAVHLPEIKVNNLSYSRIDTFQTCPLKYKFRYLFEIPSPTPHAANFGSSVHNTVNEFYQSIMKGAEPSLDLLKNLYEKLWIGSGYEGKSHEQARKKKGWEIMEKFYEAEAITGFRIPAFLEKSFRLKIGGLTFSGRIDRIDQLEDGTYEVIDYKTGTYKKDAKLEKDLQLSLYALACRDVFKIPVSKLSLYFLEDSRKASTTRKDEDLEFLKDELIRFSKELRESKMLPTPGHHCGWCEYRILCHAAQ